MEELDKLLESSMGDSDRKYKIARLHTPAGQLKRCNLCGNWKAVEEFYLRSDRGSADRLGRLPICKPCSLIKYQEWYEKNKDKERKKGRVRSYLKRHAGRLTEEEAIALVETREGYCEICGEVALLNIDHCHTTGARRGMLCGGCNSMLGHAKDNPNVLSQAACYLIKYMEK